MNDSLAAKVCELRRFAELEGTELGEAWAALIDAAERSAYLSDEFTDSLELEITAHIAEINASARIVEKTELQTAHIRYLEWNDG